MNLGRDAQNHFKTSLQSDLSLIYFKLQIMLYHKCLVFICLLWLLLALLYHSCYLGLKLNSVTLFYQFCKEIFKAEINTTHPRLVLPYSRSLMKCLEDLEFDLVDEIEWMISFDGSFMMSGWGVWVVLPGRGPFNGSNFNVYNDFVLMFMMKWLWL